MLSADQVACYRRDGFVVLDPVIRPSEVDELRAAVESTPIAPLLEERGRATRGVHLNEATTLAEPIRELAADSRVTDRVAALIGPDLELQNSKVATKPARPGTGAFGWHQDARSFPHTNDDLLTVMVVLDDSTVDNGCMFMVPRSNHLPVLVHDEESGECLASEHWGDPSQLVAITPRAGGVSIHSSKTLHYSPASRSGEERRSLIFVYRAADNYQLAGPVFSDTGWLVRGTKPTRIRCSERSFDLGGVEALPLPAHLPSAYQQIGEQARARNDRVR